MRKTNIFSYFFILLKFTKLLKALKFLKFGKIFITFFSMTLSAFVYSFIFGIWFAVGLVIMLFVHEMGHVIAMKMKGMPTKAPVFIPMLGAIIFAPAFKNSEEEAFIGYGGPLLGTIGAIFLFGIWALMPGHHELLLLVSYIGAFINLFNLIPIRPLDGGRITQVIGKWFKYIGLACLLLFSFLIREPVILLIWIIVLQDIRMKPWLKFGLGIVCQTAMMLLMYMGFSTQKFWVDIIDIAVATILNLLFYWGATRQQINEVETEKIEKSSMQTGIKWLILYLLLGGILVTLMAFQIPYLPKALN